MLSRVADTIFWMNRYIERAENYARFLDVNFNLSLEMPPDFDEQWKPLVVITGDMPLFKKYYDKATKSNVIRFLGFDPRNPNSIYSSTCFARENARAIRPELTKEMWEQINSLYHQVKESTAKRQWRRKDPRPYTTEVRKGCQLLYGIFESTTSRSAGWHFGKIGQLIERADKTSRVLDVKYHMLLSTVEGAGSAIDIVQWASLLKTVSGYDMYRKMAGKLSTHQIAEFLLFDTRFPRSVLGCVNRIKSSLDRIYGDDMPEDLGHIVNQTIASLDNEEISSVFEEGLHDYVNRVQINLNKLSDTICETLR